MLDEIKNILHKSLEILHACVRPDVLPQAVLSKLCGMDAVKLGKRVVKQPTKA